MLFNYLAYDSSGAKFEGEIEAESLDIAKNKLKARNLVLVKIQAVEAKNSASLFAGKGKLTIAKLEFIVSELAILLKSGVRLDKGLNILKKGIDDQASAKLIGALAKDIKAGNAVADAFAAHPESFDPLFINMVKLGEASGNLDLVFSKLADDLKFKRELTSKVVQALVYPSVILFVCVACILFVFNYIVPQMSGMFDREDELPVYTSLLLNVSEWFIQYQGWLALGLVVGGFAFIRGLSNPAFRSKVDEVGLSLPIFGKGIKLVETIRFNSSIAMGLSAGVSLVNALELATGNVRNKQIAQSLNASQSRIKQGTRLSEVLKNVPIYNDFAISLVEVGEESGNLELVFGEIAERSKQDFEGWTKTLTGMIEPVLILFMGGIVGSVVVVMLLSIVSTNDINI